MRVAATALSLVGLLFGSANLAASTTSGAPTPFDPLGESMANFSPLVRGWIVWLVVIGTSSMLFVWRHVAARWVLGAYIANHAVAIGTGSVLGAAALTNGLVSTTHVVFWTPAVIVLIRRLSKIDRASVYGAWHFGALATMAVSLFFDYRDAYIYLLTNP